MTRPPLSEFLATRMRGYKPKRDTDRYMHLSVKERRARVFEWLTRSSRGLAMKTGKKTDRFIWPGIEFRFKQTNFLAGVVYRIYDDHDHILYVGFTSNLDMRLQGHKHSAVWWPQARVVRGAHIERDPEQSSSGGTANKEMRRRGLAEELRLIRKLRPPYNLVGVKA